MKIALLCSVSVLLASCSTLSGLTDTTNLVNYSNHKGVKVLSVPDDLDPPGFEDDFLVSHDVDISKASGPVSVRVPNVDESIGRPSSSELALVSRDGGLALKVARNLASQKDALPDALKAMGMTINDSNVVAGTYQVRDRSQVSDPGSPIGRLLNRGLGRLNQGDSYLAKLVVEEGTSYVSFLQPSGKPLAGNVSRPLYQRLIEAYQK